MPSQPSDAILANPVQPPRGAEGRAPASGGTLFDPEQFDRLSAATVPGYEALQEWVAIAVASEAGPTPRILDLGCGTGAGLLALGRQIPGARLTGCDPSADMLAAARARCAPLGDRVEWVQGSIETLPDHPPFDAIVCTLVLHFLPYAEKREFLSAIRQRLRPEGILVVSGIGRALEPSGQALWGRIRTEYSATKGIPPEVFAARQEQAQKTSFPLTDAELREHLLEAGFHEPTPLYRVLSVYSWYARA